MPPWLDIADAFWWDFLFQWRKSALLQNLVSPGHADATAALQAAERAHDAEQKALGLWGTLFQTSNATTCFLRPGKMTRQKWGLKLWELRGMGSSKSRWGCRSKTGRQKLQEKVRKCGWHFGWSTWVMFEPVLCFPKKSLASATNQTGSGIVLWFHTFIYVGLVRCYIGASGAFDPRRYDTWFGSREKLREQPDWTDIKTDEFYWNFQDWAAWKAGAEIDHRLRTESIWKGWNFNVENPSNGLLRTLRSHERWPSPWLLEPRGTSCDVAGSELAHVLRRKSCDLCRETRWLDSFARATDSLLDSWNIMESCLQRLVTASHPPDVVLTWETGPPSRHCLTFPNFRASYCTFRTFAHAYLSL